MCCKFNIQARVMLFAANTQKLTRCRIVYSVAGLGICMFHFFLRVQDSRAKGEKVGRSFPRERQLTRANIESTHDVCVHRTKVKSIMNSSRLSEGQSLALINRWGSINRFPGAILNVSGEYWTYDDDSTWETWDREVGIIARIRILKKIIQFKKESNSQDLSFGLKRQSAFALSLLH